VTDGLGRAPRGAVRQQDPCGLRQFKCEPESGNAACASRFVGLVCRTRNRFVAGTPEKGRPHVTEPPRGADLPWHFICVTHARRKPGHLPRPIDRVL
jgi:hypothetical protein